ncbi:LON peptidase substrate-binding domain-containing protein [Granulosicoccus sp. 3-233]|uniref:LON peptidase substrate-binding domain-containing protein n=1 Tax=Granulosicoccus sp. 3-233 TaxID=3417969 RepID=UPI003D351425
MQLPLFPLSSIVLPDGLMPLRLFERRYIDMIKDCFRNDSGFGVCLIKSGREAGGVAEPYPLGTRVSIVDFDQGSDGLLHITVKGEEEFRLLTYVTADSGLLVGEVEVFAARPPTPMLPEFELLAKKLDLILSYLETDIHFEQMRLDDADWVSHRLLEVLPLASEAKYELLQMESNHERLNALRALQIEIAERPT